MDADMNDDGGIQFYQTHQQNEEQQMNNIAAAIDAMTTKTPRQQRIDQAANLYSLAIMTGVGLSLELGDRKDPIDAYDRVIAEFMAALCRAHGFSREEERAIRAEATEMSQMRTDEFIALVKNKRAAKGGAA